MPSNLTSHEQAVVADFVHAFRGLTRELASAAENRYRAAPGTPASKGAGADPVVDTVLDPARLDLGYAIQNAASALRVATANIKAATALLVRASEPYSN